MPSTTVVELVTQAKAQVENLTPEQVAREAEQGAVLVDLREPAGLQRDGMIQGAIQAPRGMLEFYADPTSPYHRDEFDPNRRTILYCASGGRSALGAVALAELCYTDVAHLDGGIKAWRTDGRPITSPAE
jgi:rhodanese-related sulfurtransferase